MYRGYRVRSMLSDATGPKAERAALLITRFMRQVGKWRREAAARDREESARVLQAAFKKNADLKDFRATCRRRVTNALAVLGGGSVSKVLRGVGWGTYAPPAAGGSGVYKQSWAVTAAGLAGFSRLTPMEQALTPEVRAPRWRSACARVPCRVCQWWLAGAGWGWLCSRVCDAVWAVCP
jgi:hypothetical protein